MDTTEEITMRRSSARAFSFSTTIAALSLIAIPAASQDDPILWQVDTHG